MYRNQWIQNKKKRELEKSASSSQTDRSKICEIKKDTEKKRTRKNPCKSMRKIINEKNLWESVKSVGRNNPHEEKSASSAKSAWQKQQESISGASHWPAAKYLRKSVSNPISKIAIRFIREIRWRKTNKPQKSFEIWGSSLKGGGDLLSRIALQYHRRKRA